MTQSRGGWVSQFPYKVRYNEFDKWVKQDSDDEDAKDGEESAKSAKA